MERLIFRRIYEREITFSMITSFGDPDRRHGHHQGHLGRGAAPGRRFRIAAQVGILGTEVPVYRILVS